MPSHELGLSQILVPSILIVGAARLGTGVSNFQDVIEAGEALTAAASGVGVIISVSSINRINTIDELEVWDETERWWG